MAEMLNHQLESFLTFLIESHVVDNSGSDSETLSKFLQLFE